MNCLEDNVYTGNLVWGGPDPIQELKDTCRRTNSATIQAAKARTPGSAHDQQLVQETWAKFQQDVDRGYIGAPRELDTVDLEQVLLVDSFGVWEKHASSNWKVRVINNFRSNKVNSFAWLPSKIEYDKFTELMEATRVFKRYTDGKLTLGKSDFKSAFKTLSASGEQSWLSWCLVFNPEVGRHQVAPLLSQTFGS